LDDDGSVASGIALRSAFAGAEFVTRARDILPT
jgi:hypothetical protein